MNRRIERQHENYTYTAFQAKGITNKEEFENDKNTENFF